MHAADRSEPVLKRETLSLVYNPSMSDDYQIEIPASFYALYSDARKRLTAPMDTVRQRYDICEDLASHLTEHARGAVQEGVSEDIVLGRCHLGLSSPDSGVSQPEATWVVTRLAELLGWECPPLDVGA